MITTFIKKKGLTELPGKIFRKMMKEENLKA
jgi:hypothetical protein